MPRARMYGLRVINNLLSLTYLITFQVIDYSMTLLFISRKQRTRKRAPCRGPLWGPQGALFLYPSGILIIGPFRATRRYLPIGGLGDPYGPIPRVEEGPLEGA